MGDLSLIEQVAFRIWQSQAQAESDWEGEPYTDVDFHRLTTEDTRGRLYPLAKELIGVIRESATR